MTAVVAAAVALLPAPGDALLFAAAVLVLNATPGVDVLLTLSRTLQCGVQAGMAAVVGINAGCVLHALAAAFGLAALLALHPAWFTAIQWAGAGYLAWLGLGLLLQAWRGARGCAAAAAAPLAAHTTDTRPWWADVRTGLLTNLLNPKVALFFLAFLPQFVPSASPAPTLSFLLLGAWFVLQSSLFLVLLVLATASLRRVCSQAGLVGPGFPRLQHALQALGGVLFLCLALRLLGARPAVA